MTVYLTHWNNGNAVETVHPCMDAAIDEAGAWCADEGADLVQFIDHPGHARWRAMRDGKCVSIFAALTLCDPRIDENGRVLINSQYDDMEDDEQVHETRHSPDDDDDLVAA